MKTTNKFLALALMAVAIVFTSCSKDDGDSVPTQQEIEAKIIGKWKLDTKEGEKYLTNNKVVMTFNDNHEYTYSCSRKVEPYGGYIWVNKAVAPYKLDGNLLSWTLNGFLGYGSQDVVISEISNNTFSYDERITALNDGTIVKDKGIHTFKRVTADYSQDIIGLWEGVELTGEETYGNAEARIEYHTDGTYTYFKKYADIWCPSENVDNEYNVDGDWLATRWRPEKGADYNYEWWDIDDVKDGTMNWSALREKENGERYTTTFTWKKVDTPTEEQYKAMILGEWEVVEGINYELKDGKLVDSTPASLGRYHVLYTFGHDDTFSMIRKDEDGTKLMEAYGHYELRGSVVSFIYERMFFMGEPLDESEYNYGTETMGISAVDGENLTLVEYMKFEDDPNECDHLLMYMKMQRQ